MDDAPAPGFTTEWATTPDDWAALRRHRYGLLVEKAGHYRDVADHDRLELALATDARARVAFAKVDDEIVAQAAGWFGADGPFTRQQVQDFKLASFLDAVPLRMLAIIGLPLADPEAGEIPFALEADLTRRVIEEEVEVAFLASDPRRLSFHRHLGWRTYRAPIHAPEIGTWIPMLALTSDVDYFETLGSPLADLAARKQERGDIVGAVRKILKAAPFTHPSMSFDASEMYSYATDLERRESIVAFEGLEDAAVEELIERGEVLEIGAGNSIIEQGATTNSLFLVIDGLVEAYDDGRFLGVSTSGQFFGEVAFLTGQPRMSDVLAGPHGAQVLALDPKVFDDLIGSDPGRAAKLLFNLARDLATKLLQSQQGIVTAKM